MKKLADRFFRWYCDPDYYSDIKGDLEELYNRNSEKSIASANRILNRNSDTLSEIHSDFF